MLQPETECRPRIEIFADGEPRAVGLVQRNADLERNQNLRHDSGTEFVHVFHRAGKPIRPNDTAVTAVRQLDRNGQLAPERLDIAPQTVAHPEQTSSLDGIGDSAASTER
ncbi:MAG: hypothetical protein U5O39_10485 [Gammaproteobacteria bacterium]|nr:hypothetical protein [Gammaproteobacteria bacterium]